MPAATSQLDKDKNNYVVSASGRNEATYQEKR
jgi:hypothetical protein